jgi:hypothetical protein
MIFSYSNTVVSPHIPHLFTISFCLKKMASDLPEVPIESISRDWLARKTPQQRAAIERRLKGLSDEL